MTSTVARRVKLRPASIALALTLLLGLGCDSRVESVRLDASYSQYLTTMSSSFVNIGGQNALRTVSVAQVFEGAPRAAVSISSLASRRLLYETRDPTQIEALFVAAQQDLAPNPPPDHCRLDDSRAMTLIAFDSSLPRAAVIRLYPCTISSGLILLVRPLGDVGLGYSRELAEFFMARYLIPKEWMVTGGADSE